MLHAQRQFVHSSAIAYTARNVYIYLVKQHMPFSNCAALVGVLIGSVLVSTTNTTVQLLQLVSHCAEVRTSAL
jgi:hypothetical protein